MYVDVNNKEINTGVSAVTNKEMQKFLMEEFPEQINMNISALESDDHEIL
jgi:hypothetical protein